LKLQTHIPLKPQKHNQLNYDSKVLLLGSCFVENIGKKLDYFKFQNTINPFGIMFHPVAIEKVLVNAINEKEFSEQDIFYHNEQWHCFDAHSQLSNFNNKDLLMCLNEETIRTHKEINQSTHIIITLGTAWAYRQIETDAFVANCHKMPQKYFLKELLSVKTISESLEAIIALIKSVNPKVSILFTVSPVRHIKDGFVENTRSKAHLLTAIHEVVEARNSLYYFPSYEIMMDELRDYRFYNDDMIHPNQTAINYVWERFESVWIADSAKKIMPKVSEIQKALAHKPFNENSEAHNKFLENLRLKQISLQKLYPHFNF